MAFNQSSEALRRPRNAFRIGFTGLGLLALVFGFVGFEELARLDEQFAGGWLDLNFVYHDVQLFVLGSDPLQNVSTGIPLSLQFARFAAPAATVYALAETIRSVFAVELSRRQARRAKGHVIVCGDSDFADAITRRLRADRVRVIEIRREVDESVNPGEPFRVIGDGHDPEALRAAGIEHADMVYACARDSATNVAVALTVGQVRRERRGELSVYSHIPDAELCAIFQADLLSRAERDGVRLDYFNIDNIAARRLFAQEHLEPLAGRPPSMVVSGTGGFAGSVIVEAARAWRQLDPEGHRPLPLCVVGENAGRRVEVLSQRYPFLPEVCRFDIRETDLLTLLLDGGLAGAPDRCVVANDDEERALKTAVMAERLWNGRVRSIVVRLDGLAGSLATGPGAAGTRLMRSESSVLRVFGVTGAACEPSLIQEDLLERLAQVIHEQYLRARHREGSSSSHEDSRQPWERLSARLRQANRAQAEDIGRKLAAIGCLIVPRFAQAGEHSLAPSDIELLARLEHERWCAEQERAGWRFAEERDAARKLHPSLLPWASLPESMRSRNYDPVRNLSTVLSDAGFRIVAG